MARTGRPAMDLTGQVFGRLTVIKRAENNAKGVAWLCLCSCGVQKTVAASNLRSGNTVSCSCYAREIAFTNNRSHGLVGTGGYRSYRAMINRTTNPKSKDYPRYGGSGVKVCLRYRESYANLHNDIGDRPKGYSIDRVDTSGHYSCGSCTQCRDNNWGFNVRWATINTQNNNRGKYNIYIEFSGKKLTIGQWSHEVSIPPNRLYERYHKGWPPEKILCTPTHRLTEFNGRLLTKAEWAMEYGISDRTLSKRLQKGWSLEEALTTPVYKNRRPY